MIGVADVATDRQPKKLAAKMLLETRANNLLTIVEIFGTDEAYDVLASSGENSRATP